MKNGTRRIIFSFPPSDCPISVPIQYCHRVKVWVTVSQVYRIQMNFVELNIFNLIQFNEHIVSSWGEAAIGTFLPMQSNIQKK
jgi:hypothetical protein